MTKNSKNNFLNQNNRQPLNPSIPYFRKMGIGALLLASTSAFPTHAMAQTFAPTAFTSCPGKAFLTQGTVPQTFGVNLITGDYTVLSQDHGTIRPLNAIGFNSNDRFIYAWSNELGQPVRIHKDWQIEKLGRINITDRSFYVGDVDVERNIYYVYRRGVEYGLYAIGLDETRSDYMKMTRIVDGLSLSLRSADMAVNPVDGFIYAVESNGTLHRIDQSDGSSIKLGYTGREGTFGAAYFDSEGNLYVGRNNDGKIFRIAVSAGEVNAKLFASGPASSTNDGSRCALAPLIDDANTDIDFGDAPDSYLTSLNANGARHGLLSNPDLFLGSGVDGESNAYIYPLSDDKSGELNDDDGIKIIVEAVERDNAIAMVTSSGDGYLNAWIDFHQDGQFDAIDQVAINMQVKAGEQAVYLPIPDGVTAGTTWARFRLSSAIGLQPHGGAPDGEVEDMQVRLHSDQVIVKDYPSSTSWTTISYEDNWPLLGDYDMNDLVVYMRTSTQQNNQGFTKVAIKGQISAAGARYHNGFGIRLPGVLRTDVNENLTKFIVNGKNAITRNPLETHRKEAILIISEDVFDHVGAGNHCTFYRTETGCGSDIQMSFEVSVVFNAPVDVPLFGAFDPFLFATENKWHGEHFVSPPGRSYEIHLKNHTPTEAFNTALFSGAGNDSSNPDQALYFQSNTGMPWAIEVGDRWDYPLEYAEITAAYPQFTDFSASKGESSVYWYNKANAIEEHLFSE